MFFFFFLILIDIRDNIPYNYMEILISLYTINRLGGILLLRGICAMENIVSLKNLVVEFEDGERILKDISLDIKLT